MRFGCVACLLLAVLFTARGDDSISSCSRTDDTGLLDTIRQSACRLRGNKTEGDAFKASIQKKHGVTSLTTSSTFAFANLFRHTTSKVWCRTNCEDFTPENVTWCVNIGYPEGEVETCITAGTGAQEVITNSSCEAETVGLARYISLPSDCTHYGNLGCLGLTNLDWFFQFTYFTCTVHTETCYEKSFTELLTLPVIAVSPEFDVFPTSPHLVLSTDSIVLHLEITSATDRIAIKWQHAGKNYTEFIHESPYCTQESCTRDPHPNATFLRQQRVRPYQYTHIIRMDGCQTKLTYKLVSYLIIDNATEEDSGSYNFTSLTTYHGYAPIYQSRSVNVSVHCQVPDDGNKCKPTMTENKWTCRLTAAPGSNFSLLLDNKTVVLPSKPGAIKCKGKPQILFSVLEDPRHKCFSSYSISVTACPGVAEEFAVMADGETHATVELSEVEVNIEHQSSDKSEDGPNVVVVTYTVPLPVLVVGLIVMIIVLLVLLRARKRQRVITRVQSPNLKEMSFFKQEGELGLLSPSSPHLGDPCFADPLEFPRNRLYIYSSRVLGEGSFGRVLQAKAEGIVPGMPDRNVVAIKTTKENASSLEREELLAELQLMKSMEPHENILNLLGQCTTGDGPVCLIVEYATYGNLRDFLRQCEEVVLSLNHLPHIPRNRSRTRTFSASSTCSTQPLITRQDSSVFTPGSGQTHFVFPSPSGHVSSGSCSSSNGELKLTAQHPSAAAVPLAHSVAPIGHDYLNTKGLVYMEDVHNFALQIACGLQHLASMQIVHCDLAARNVLIAEGFVLKIADFGLARDISGRDVYKKNPRGKIPVKWTAPEALEHRIFTVQSDVWSYGVLLWELFTYGHTPYPDVHLGPSYEPFISYLKDGNRMSQPESSPAAFYELMLECWHLNPDLRPSPYDIVSRLTPTESVFEDEVDCELNGEQPIHEAADISVSNGGQHVHVATDSLSNGAGQQSSQE